MTFFKDAARKAMGTALSIASKKTTAAERETVNYLSQRLGDDHQRGLTDFVNREKRESRRVGYFWGGTIALGLSQLMQDKKDTSEQAASTPTVAR